MKAKPNSLRYQALEMYQRGATIRSISLTLGVSSSTVSKWVKRLGNSKQVRRLSKAYRSITVNITEENWHELENQKVMSVCRSTFMNSENKIISDLSKILIMFVLNLMMTE